MKPNYGTIVLPPRNRSLPPGPRTPILRSPLPTHKDNGSGWANHELDPQLSLLTGNAPASHLSWSYYSPLQNNTPDPATNVSRKSLASSSADGESEEGVAEPACAPRLRGGGRNTSEETTFSTNPSSTEGGARSYSNTGYTTSSSSSLDEDADIEAQHDGGGFRALRERDGEDGGEGRVFTVVGCLIILALLGVLGFVVGWVVCHPQDDR